MSWNTTLPGALPKFQLRLGFEPEKQAAGRFWSSCAQGPDNRPILGRGTRQAAMPTPKSRADRTLADFWRSYVDSGRGVFGYVVRNPGDALRAFLAIQRLPFVYPADHSDTPGGREVGRVIHRKGPLGLPARWWSFAALPVPDSPEDSLKRPEAKRLRYQLRCADEENITCRPVDPDERAALLERANARERVHTNPAYRVDDPRNDDLLEHDLWFVAQDDTGEPLILAVAATDGEFAVLRYFRTLGDGENHSLSRYPVHVALVEALAAQRVRWLLDPEPPAAQKNGVRLFQRIVGFRHVRIRKPRSR
jgi:hypothetical protein